jgi:cobalt/nickel transport system permease protein
MLGNIAAPLLAVHISDGVLTPPWLAGGFVLAALLALAGAWRIRDEEIPRVALLTAAFFVASLLHIQIGPTSAHLLLNGLVGVILGWRAALAIPVGLFLQAALIGHGGYLTLGVNSCVMVLPALLAWQLFALVRRVPWVRRPWFRSVLVAGSTLLWTLSVVYSVTLLISNGLGRLSRPDTGWADFLTFHPVTLAAALAVAAAAAWAERRLENAPEFPVGLLVGEVAVLATVLLHCLALVWGGPEQFHTLAMVSFVVHLPIAVVEGTVLGFTVGFLVRVKPEMLGWVEAPPATPAGPGAASVNGQHLQGGPAPATPCANESAPA